MVDLILREPRLPLYVAVETDPTLPQCFSSNVSASGMGLVCAGSAEAILREGQRLVLRFSLPNDASVVRAEARVMWSFGRQARTGEGIETAVGVRFDALAGDGQAIFSRYLIEHRHHVAVAFADAEEAERVRLVAHDFYELHFDDSEAAVLQTLQRGDISTLIGFGHSDVIARVLGQVGPALAPELMPLLVYCGSSAGLAPLVKAGHMFRALPKPVDAAALSLALQKSCAARGEREQQARAAQSFERAYLRERAAARPKSSLDRAIAQRIICESASLQRALERLKRVAPHKVSTLLFGETGAGKEVIARLLHELSPRATAALVVQDCGTLPATLLDSALFGHVKGAFTGAQNDSPGLFVLADGGTMFLDEIENTTPELQAKLLRVIETGEVRPVGGSKTRQVDVRIVAATNRDLAVLVEQGSFRMDLYYRLNVFPIAVPPLRERREDILPLAQRFLAAAVTKLGRRDVRLTSSAERALQAYTWPGNVRELQNAIEASVLLADDGARIEAVLLPEAVQRGHSARASTALATAVDAFERDLIARALEAESGVILRAAKRLATNAVTLRRKALAYGLLKSAR